MIPLPDTAPLDASPAGPGSSAKAGHRLLRHLEGPTECMVSPPHMWGPDPMLPFRPAPCAGPDLMAPADYGRCNHIRIISVCGNSTGYLGFAMHGMEVLRRKLPPEVRVRTTCEVYHHPRFRPPYTTKGVQLAPVDLSDIGLDNNQAHHWMYARYQVLVANPPRPDECVVYLDADAVPLYRGVVHLTERKFPADTLMSSASSYHASHSWGMAPAPFLERHCWEALERITGEWAPNTGVMMLRGPAPRVVEVMRCALQSLAAIHETHPDSALPTDQLFMAGFLKWYGHVQGRTLLSTDGIGPYVISRDNTPYAQDMLERAQAGSQANLLAIHCNGNIFQPAAKSGCLARVFAYAELD